MTIDDFRRIALSMPQAIEAEHMGHPDFRVKGKIFATIWPAEGWGMVKLKPDQQRDFIRWEPAVFVPVKGGWGKRGCTNVKLEAAGESSVYDAMVAAWRNVAPKRLVEEFSDKI
ncbi:MAG TPA: MmcQ/YjbR family DNA-binding protein [Gemmataceae bacterium]|jgi:hypothetical protein|nr:MmcQ/YjbR family DNA-binding protein [Gemmataceae bacterium]